MVLAAAGGVDHEELVAIAEKNFGKLSSEYKGPSLTLPKFTGSEIRDRDDSRPLAHVVRNIMFTCFQVRMIFSRRL